MRVRDGKGRDAGVGQMMANMVGMLEMVVRQVRTKDTKDLQVDLRLRDVVEQLLTKSHQEKINYFLKLSQSLEASVA